MGEVAHRMLPVLLTSRRRGRGVPMDTAESWPTPGLLKLQRVVLVPGRGRGDRGRCQAIACTPKCDPRHAPKGTAVSSTGHDIAAPRSVTMGCFDG